MNIKYYLLIIISSITLLNAQETPTERYLIENPIEQIQDHFYREYLGSEFKAHRHFFQKVVENEKSGNVLGYHASTQNFRIFQDILRAVFEEIFEYSLPEDFYFLRVPGHEDFDFPEGKLSFFEQFGRDLGEETLDLMVETFLFSPFKQRFGHQLSIDEFPYDEQQAFREIFLDFASFLDSLDAPLFQIDFDTVPKSMDLPNIRYVPNQNEPPEVSLHKKEVAKKLKDLLNKANTIDSLNILAIPPFHVDLDRFSQLLKNGLKKHKIDVSKKTIKGWLTNQVKPKELMLSFWYLNYGAYLSEDDYARIETFFMPFLDTRPEQQKRLICMNIPLYGNYFRWDESSVSIFLEDSSIEGGDRHVKKALKAFFSDIGLEKTLVNQLFESAKNQMRNDPGSKHGCLYQLMDTDSDFPYLETDSSSYVSFDFGVPLYETTPAEVITGSHPIRGKNVDLQLRLVMSNQSVLNPYGKFRIVRYDEVSSSTAKIVLDAMKDQLRNANNDHEKVKNYQNKLNMTWGK